MTIKNIAKQIGLVALVSVLTSGCLTKDQENVEKNMAIQIATKNGWSEVIITDKQRLYYNDWSNNAAAYYFSGISPKNKNTKPKQYDTGRVVCADIPYNCKLEIVN